MRIGLVNRFYPPDPAPTGLAARDLAHHLATALPGARLTVYASRAVYAPGPAPAEPIPPENGTAPVRVCRRPGLYAGKARLPRLAASLLEGWGLARQAVGENDLVIALSDPPLLPLWVDAAARRAGRPWIEWTMDLYPEVFAAAGLVSADHPLYRWLAVRAHRLAPALRLCLGPAQQNWLAAHRERAVPAVVLPGGIVAAPRTAPIDGRPRPPPVDGRLTVAGAGNYGEAHPPEVLLRLIGRADPGRFRFRLALHGRHAGRLRRQLAGHPAVDWQDHLADAELAAAEAHFVCLGGRFTDLCVPSKAATAVGLGCPVLFAGRPAADTWRMLAEGPVPAGWLIPETPDGTWRDAALDAALAGLADPAQRAARTAAAATLADRLADTRRQAFDQIAGWLRQTLGGR